MFLVLGAGPAGCAAAIMAARLGARTLLVDALNVPGGMSTADMLLYTFAAEPFMESDTVKGVIVQNKSGRSAILAAGHHRFHRRR